MVAAAVQCGAQFILTFNLRHFRPEHLQRWGTVAVHPQTFLVELYRQDPAVVRAKLSEQAADRGRDLPQLLKILSATVPAFVALLSADQR